MVNTKTCDTLFNGHCRHWHLSDTQHAIAHAMARRTEEVYQQDVVQAGLPIGTSHSSIADDGPRIEAILADEGFAIVPLARA